jgi:transcriptional accessory protein Tex/SPT6
MSKTEKIVILVILIAMTIAWVLMFFKQIDPKPVPVPPSMYEAVTKELEKDNKKLEELIDSINTVDSLHLVELHKTQNELNNKKNEIRKIIKFLPDANSKFRDSLWTVYLKD